VDGPCSAGDVIPITVCSSAESRFGKTDDASFQEGHGGVPILH